MSEHLTRFGATAYSTLVSVVRELKCTDPLRPVTVLVPTDRIGVAARRALARGDGRPGIAALRVLTLRRLAESLAGPELIAQGRRPLTTMTLAATVRDVLRDVPGQFATVADHIGTVRALANAHRELRPVARLDEMASGEVVAEDAVRIHREILRRTASTSYDEVDLLQAASGLAFGVDGDVVAFLLRDLDAPEQALLDAIPDLHTLQAVGEEPVADRVLHASDSDDEVRAAVREVVGALHEGVPGHRIAVLHGSVNPYGRLLHEHLGRAGVTFFGRGIRPTLESPYGRGLLRLLQLPDHGFRRDEVLAWITDSPVRFRGERAPSSRWERASRAAGVVRDSHWNRLALYADQRAVRQPAAASAARDLLEFVEDLRSRFEAIAAASTWADLGELVRALWEHTLADPDDDSLPPDDARAVRRISATLDGITHLPGHGHPRALRELVELQLADDLDRVGTIGIGVHVGSIADGYGEDVDRLIVVGAAEGILPSRPTDDPLIPDRVRERTDGALPTTTERLARQWRDFQAGLAAAPPGGRTVLFPRGDLRGGGSRVPSRWLLPSLRRLSGNETLTLTNWEHADGLEQLPSYVGAIASAQELATPQEWRQRTAMATGAVDSLTRVLQGARLARRSPAFTAYDGNLAGESLPDPTSGAPASASALEQWAACPWNYFVRRLLHARPVELPEDVVRVSPMVRGNLMHAALEGLVTQARAESWAPTAHERWPETSWAVLERHAHTAFEKARADGLTGFDLLWQEDSTALLGDLRNWLTRDDERRASYGGLTPIAAEWAFGGTAQPEVLLDLGDGRELSLRGSIDRIDADTRGRLVVTDYKSGRRPTASAAGQPWDGGRRLQLPLYALAAAGHFAHPDGEPVRSAYWYTSRNEGFAEDRIEIDDAQRESAMTTVRAIVDGIVHGVFPARATQAGQYYQGRPTSGISCPACDPDGLGEQIDLSWEELGESPTLRGLHHVHALLFPEART
jgi:ATP-dependent helicase/nuclease subunit B